MSARTKIKVQERGWGWGEFRKGRRIHSIAEMQVGRLYLEWDYQFDAKNIFQVTHGDETGLKRDIIYGRFMDPLNPSQGALGNAREFALWGWELRRNEVFEALPKA